MSESTVGSRRVLGFAASFGAVGIIGNVAQLAYTAVTARAIGPAGYAPYAAALLALTLIAVATSAGVASAILRAPDWERERERGYLLFIVLVGVVCAVAMVLLSYVWDRISGVEGSGAVVRLCAPLALITPLGLVGATLVRREGRGQRAAAIEATAQLTGFVVGAALVVVFRTPQSLVASLAVSAIATLVLTWSSLGRFPRMGSLGAARAEIRFTLGITPLGFSAYALTSIPAYWAARNLSADTYAKFTRANLVAAIPAQQLSGALSKAAVPEFRELAPSRLQIALRDLVVLGWASSSLLLGFLAAMAEPVVALLLGPSWIGTGTWIALACIAWALSVPENLLSQFTEFQGRKRALWTAQASAFVTVIVSIALMGRTSFAEYTPAVAVAVLFGTLLIVYALLQRDGVVIPRALPAMAVQFVVAVAAFLVVRGAVALGGSWAGLAGEIVGAAVMGVAVLAVLALTVRRLPAGRVMHRRGLLPAWVPGDESAVTH